MGISIDQNILHALLFADDPMVFAKDTDMEYMVRKFKEEYEIW